MPEESIPQFPRGRLHADVVLGRMLRDIVAVGVKRQIMRACQSRHEFLIGIRLSPAQFVIEVNDRENDAKFVTQLEQ